MLGPVCSETQRKASLSDDAGKTVVPAYLLLGLGLRIAQRKYIQCALQDHCERRENYRNGKELMFKDLASKFHLEVYKYCISGPSWEASKTRSTIFRGT